MGVNVWCKVSNSNPSADLLVDINYINSLEQFVILITSIEDLNFLRSFLCWLNLQE